MIVGALSIVNTPMQIQNQGMGMKELGEVVRAARGAMSNKELEQSTGIDASKLSRLQGGTLKETPPPQELQALEDVLKIPQHEMLRLLGYEVGPSEFATKLDLTDPRELLLLRVRALPWNRGVAGALEIAVKVLEEQERQQKERD